MITSVTAPCRLHFGLFHVPAAGEEDGPGGGPPRKFGGVGLMIGRPSLEIRLTPADSDEARGSLARRALRAAEQVRRADPPRAVTEGPVRVIADGPPEHIGLGVGTALGLAVAAALCSDRIGYTLEPPELARVAGRGKRSAVGTYGFYHGGYLVDDGWAGDEFPALADRLDFPADWRVVLARPPVPADWHGDRERAAFSRPRPPGAAAETARKLRRLADETMTPAVGLGDFEEFAAAVYEFNRIAGEPFAAIQGGPYAGPAVASTVDLLRSFGAVGVGQSSWGPTVFAFAPGVSEADELARRAREALPDGAVVDVAEPANSGSCLSHQIDTDQVAAFEAEWETRSRAG
jgi:beta-RFAP synthase